MDRAFSYLDVITEFCYNCYMRKQITKECPKHGMTIFKERRDKRHPDRQYWRCSKCEYESVKKRRQKIKQKLVEIHGGKCIRCGYNKSLRALSFHHRNREDKKFRLSSCNHIKWDDLLEESMKCDLLCANCHMEIEEEIGL